MTVISVLPGLAKLICVKSNDFHALPHRIFQLSLGSFAEPFVLNWFST